VTATGINRVYDATVAATVTLHDDRVLNDAFALSYSASFLDKNVGTGKTVNVSAIAITANSGPEAGDYAVGNTTTSTTANITQATVTGSFTAADKYFDLNTAATILTRSLSGVYTGDQLTLTGGTASFDTPAVGSGKKVTGTGFSLSGGDFGNYVLASTTLYTTASITYTRAAGAAFLQPVNLYPQPKSSFKLGSTIPAKFQLFLANGTTPYGGANATFSYVRTSNAANDPVNEDVVTIAADAGVTFRYDPTAQQYIFNWGTKNLQAGGYTIMADLHDGGPPISAPLELRTK
jgi:hypothetical protein